MTTETTTSGSATQQLLALGQSVWLDYLSRDLIRSGKLQRMVADREITGMTSNPTIFEKALSGSDDYDDALEELARDRDISPYDAFVSIAVDDIRGACDALRSVYDTTRGVDGYVSLELPPGIENDTEKSVAEAKRLWKRVDRPNLMIKVPGTLEGIPAVTALTAEGVNVNITLLFSVAVYEQVAEAYITGLEQRLALGRPLDTIASVASFFVSRVDTAVDALLPDDSPLRGKVAVANARRAYERYLEIFSGPRWERLAAAGAHVQRPLWASTGTKNKAYSDVLYVEELVAANTVNTLPEATLRALQDHGVIAPSITDHFDEAREILRAAEDAGIDLRAVTDRLLVEGLASFDKDFRSLLGGVSSSLALARVGRPGPLPGDGEVGQGASQSLEQMEKAKVISRIWAHDHTVWKENPSEISDRLGWLDIGKRMVGEVSDLEAFARAAAADGFRHAVLLGMGGSSLAPEVLQATFGTAPGMLALHVLDTTDPDQIAATEAAIDLQHTLFIVSSKSGGTIETLSQFEYFWQKAPAGSQYVVITDPGSALERLGRERNVRRIFLADAEIGGRYSALSFFGLVPAAFIGVDLGRLLARANEMADACGPQAKTTANPGAWLGAILGAAALCGRDKLTLVLPPQLAALGYWIEQLVAESTGKEGKGIVPIEGETLGDPAVYGTDRLFVAIGDEPALTAIEVAGQPAARVAYSDPYQLGAEFFRWELATAVAGHVLGINPFDQPNVQEAKDATNRVLGGGDGPAASEAPRSVLEQAHAGDYIAITAYLPRTPGMIDRLQAIRLRLRDRYGVATTVGFGPRFLHSTGQLHKGGANNGVFLQLVHEPANDRPVPGKPFTFATLERAQADGDLASLQAHGRRASRTTLETLETEVAR